MPKTSDVGVIVGRFQVHRLHEAHRTLISSVYDTHPQTIVVLGLSPTRVTIRNPLDFEARKQMILDAFPKATVLYLRDRRDDALWSKALDELIETVVSPRRTVCLYGGRDSFINHYTGQHKTVVLEPDVYASGTELRKDIARSVKASEDFRAGVIWATANGYPRVFPTVDVAVYRGDLKQPREVDWLFVRKPGELCWRFPGGFVQPTDASYADAAVRELYEETGASVGRPEYVASIPIDDWRYRNEEDQIITTLFAVAYISGPIVPHDDVAEAGWFKPVQFAGLQMIVEEHHPLVKALFDGGYIG